MAGRKPGAPKTGGRKKGTPNKIGADVREEARKYTADALAVLAKIMKDVRAPSAARVAAAIHLLDRAEGKPKQTVEAAIRPIYAISDKPMTDAEWEAAFASQPDPSSPSGHPRKAPKEPSSTARSPKSSTVARAGRGKRTAS